MKLRAKLFLTVSILLILMAIAMYILPTFFIRKDVESASGHIEILIEKEHEELVSSQKVLLKDLFERMGENLNALLFIIYEEKDLSEKLTLSKEGDLKTAWETIVKIAGYDPEIGFIQLHAPETGKAMALLPHSASFYAAKSVKLPESEIVITLELPSGKQNIYRGIPLSKSSDQNSTYLALVNREKATQEIQDLEAERKEAGESPLSKNIEIPELLFNPDWVMKSAVYWAIKMNMIQILTPLFAEGLTLNEDNFVPEGIVRIDNQGNGIAILSQDVFRTEAVFDDINYYTKNAPPSSAPTLAEGEAIIIDEKEKHIFLGNTLLIDNSTFLTIGTPLIALIRQLALSSNKTILMNADQTFWIGFDENGKELSLNQIRAFISAGLTSQNENTLKINGRTYLFAKTSILEGERLTFYNLRSMGGDLSIQNTLTHLQENLRRRISLQLFLISLITMALILLFIGRITLNIIRPITRLANSTIEVAAGHYDEVSFPEVGNRKDEVATLILAFQEMVKNIQEREKIRGILDKVVSKDVAEEILKKGILLGGEDRIATILFGDIRGFTHLTENLPPQKTIQLLNACMTKISRVIEGEGGVIDKYVGDEVMAIYGAPTAHADHALRAVSTGMLMVETLKKWNQERADKGESLVEMGIGIHTGLVVAGNMGAQDRLNYTVLGASVNLAERLCAAAKANQLIISENTLAEPNVKKSFHVEPLEPISLKGFSKPINIYEVIGFKWEED